MATQPGRYVICICEIPVRIVAGYQYVNLNPELVPYGEIEFSPSDKSYFPFPYYNNSCRSEVQHNFTILLQFRFNLH